MPLGSFEVHAGDFKAGGIHHFGRKKLIMKRPWKLFRERVKFKNIESVEVATEDSVKRLGGTVGWGVAGGLLLGPVGLIAGLLAGGAGKDVTFVCQLKDGRKFMATARSKDYNKLAAAMFK